MNHKMLIALGLIVLGMVAFAASPATAMNGYGYGYPPLPSWSHTLTAYSRFVVLLNMNREAVLDKETGLVWEQSPSLDPENWPAAQFHCNSLTKGNRKGWRLPTVQELESLVDPSRIDPALPNGHPFSNVQSTNTWTSTTSAGDPANAWRVNFFNGSLSPGVNKVNNIGYVWCVRGGQGVDPQ